jgi:hypothetical protein
MRFAYADPPYPGMARLYKDQPLHSEVNHPLLIAHLCDEFPDGWALSTASTTLQYVLPLCPPDVRVMAWVKPFASFKPNVNPAYAWEPVLVRGGRRRTRQQETVRDWVACNVTLQRGLTGAKPATFNHWIRQVLNVTGDDELVDLFPGTGGLALVAGDPQGVLL